MAKFEYFRFDLAEYNHQLCVVWFYATLLFENCVCDCAFSANGVRNIAKCSQPTLTVYQAVWWMIIFPAQFTRPKRQLMELLTMGSRKAYNYGDMVFEESAVSETGEQTPICSISAERYS